MILLRYVVCVSAGILLSGSVQAADAVAVQKILADRCVLCHQGDAAPLGLRLDSMEGLMTGSNNGAVVAAGDPDASEIMRRVRGDSVPRMPMTGPPWLTDSEELILGSWISSGAEFTVQSDAMDTQPTKDNSGVSLSAADGNVDDAEFTRNTQSVVTYLDVAPLFAQRCAKCHTQQGLMGQAPEGFRLTSYKETLAATERVRVVPGKPAASELLRRVRGLSRPRMPFDGPPYLNDTEITLIEQWISDGARDSLGQVAPIPVGASVRFEGMLSAKNTVDDAPFIVGPDTRIDKSPHIGDQVELRARIDNDGHLVASRLRRR